MTDVPQSTALSMLHLVGGEKGGVGKTLHCQLLVNYCQVKRIPHLLIDADRSNPDVAESYPDSTVAGLEQISFSEAERKQYDADHIFLQAMTVPVIVNLPAQSDHLVDDWLERNHILEPSDKHHVKVFKWFLSNGGLDSLRLLRQSLDRYGDRLQHILVRNLAFCNLDEWTDLMGPLEQPTEFMATKPASKATKAKATNDTTLATLQPPHPSWQVQQQAAARLELRDYLTRYHVLVINLPKLSFPERDFIARERLRFTDAADHRGLHILGQQRIYTFLKTAFAQLEATQIWQPLPKPPLSTNCEDTNHDTF